MVVFEKCNADLYDNNCSSDGEIEAALEQSYIMIFENQETFNHQENPLTGNTINRETKFSYYPITTFTRTDIVKKVTVTEIQQSYYRFGFDFSIQTESIFQSL